MSRPRRYSEGAVPAEPAPRFQTQPTSAIDFQPEVLPQALPPSGTVEPIPAIEGPVQQVVDDRLLLFRYSQPAPESWLKKSILTCGECA